MAESGGSSTVGGVGYENWYFALQMVHLLVNENDTTTITPQKVREDLPLDGEDFKKIYIDDLVIDSEGIKEYYTIKRQSNGGVWNIAQLKSEGVIQAIKNQFESTPDRQIKFVSKSDSPIIREFERIKQASSRDEVVQILSKDLLKQWDELKKELEYDDNKLLQLSKKIQIRQIDEESIKDSIDSVFSAKFNAPKTFKDTLLSYAMERSVSKLSTSRKDILDHLSRQGIYEKSTLSYDEIIKDLRSASASLTSSKSLFQFEHIERAETKSILNWIKSDKQSKILTVVGGAGTGKTTVLQDVLETLTRDGIPVLAIKTDKIGFSNSEELRSSLNLPDTAERIFTKLSEAANYSILLLDQIDVLSYYLSSDRAQLHRYKELISKLEKLENVLIIISCRTFDLNNELELNQYKTNQTIEVLNFSAEQVRKIIANSNIDITRISKETLKLLENPLNLTIFIGLYKNNEQEVLSITTLQELYHELWKRIILKNEKRETIADLIFQISQDIYEQQSLTIGKSSYELKYNEELNFLLSNGIIQKSNNNISFFHQTFFDYSLARNFINSNKSISNEILNGIQGLFQRPRVKAVLDYLYHENRTGFFRECYEILFSPNYRIHFKYLVINIIGSIEEGDKDLFAIADKIFQDEKLKIPFIKSVLSDELIKWYTNSITLDVSDEITHSTFFHLCFANASRHPNSIINLIEKYENGLKKDLLVNLLIRVAVINNSKFIGLYKKYKREILSWDYSYTSILERAIEQNEFQFVYTELSSYYDNIRNYSIDIKNDYLSDQYKSIIQKVYKEDFHRGYQIMKKLFFDICEYSESKNIFEYKSIPCDAYEDFYGIPSERQPDRETVYFLYRYIIDYLSANRIESEIDDFLYSKYSISKCIGLEVLCMLPEVFFDKGFNYIFSNNGIINDFPEEDQFLQYLIGESIRSIHPYLDLSNQMVIYDKCMSVKDKCVWVSWHSGEKMRNTELFIDRYRLISKIPRNFIDSNSYMKRQFQEFERRFRVLKWGRPTGITTIMSSGSIPLPEKAYQSMSLKALKESFLQVGLTRKFRGTSATTYGHADAFKKMCADNPDKYNEFVRQLIIETKDDGDLIAIYAVNGFVGLSESSLKEEEIINLLHIIIRKQQSFKRYEYLISKIIHTLAEANKIDIILFQYVIDIIDQSSKIVSENNRFTYYIDTLFYLFRSNKFQDTIFNLIESTSIGVNERLKLYILRKIAELNKIDKHRSLRIFCKIMEVRSVDKYKYARGSIQYMVNVDVESTIHIIKQAIEEVEDENTQEWYGQLIGNLWCYSFKNSEELLSLAIDKSDKYKEGVLSFCIDLIFGKPDTAVARERAYKIVEEYLSEENEMMYIDYQKFIRATKSNNFPQHRVIIEKYINSNVRKVQFRHGALNDMLFSLAAKLPEECINLCALDIKSDYFSNQFLNNTSQRKTFDILVKAYNSLPSFVSAEFRNKTLDIIDLALEIAIEHQTYDLNKTFDILAQNET